MNCTASKASEGKPQGLRGTVGVRYYCLLHCGVDCIC